MLSARVFARSAFVAVALAFFCGAAAGAQTEAPQPIPFADFLRMFAQQPDHVADWEFVINEEKLGVNLTEHIRLAKKQGQMRQEFYPLASVKGVSAADKGYKLIFILRPGQPGLAFDPQTKTYTERADGFNAVPLDVDGLIREAEKVMGKVQVQQVGTVSVDGHPAAKIRMVISGEEAIFFYFARDLNGLLIRMDAGDANASHLNVSNISLDVPDDLFQIPQGYRQVDFSTFMRPVREKMPADQRNQPPPPGAQQGLPEVDPRSGPPTVAPTPSARKDAPKKTPSGVDVGPVPLNDPKPSYTEEARRNQVQGFVRMRLFVDATGAVKQAKIIRGLPDGLDAEATKAAYERRYRPAMKNGRPVACWVDAAIEFTLEGK